MASSVVMAPAVAEEIERETERPDLESSTDRYALRFAGATGEFLLGVQTRILMELMHPWPGARVLDVGGGHAQCAAPLARAGYRVTVLGTDARVFERARRLCGDSVDHIVGDLLAPPVGDRSFDVVVCFRIMSHVSDWRELVRGLCRVAREAVVVDFPTPLSVNALAPLMFGWKKRVEQDTRAYGMMRTGEVQREMARHGFGDASVRPQFFWPMVLHRALGRPGVSRVMEAPARVLGLTRALGSPVILRAQRGGGR
jgi:SAM-dependent methyltransferase